MEVHASLRYLRMAPRKVRLVIDSVRGLKATDAVSRLSFMKKDAARPVLKLIQSAMANAAHNFHLSKEGLKVATIMADGGPTLKRSRPRAFGRSAPIRKRTTHITLILSTDEVPSVKPATESKPTTEAAAPAKAVKAPAKPRARKTVAKKSSETTA